MLRWISEQGGAMHSFQWTFQQVALDANQNLQRLSPLATRITTLGKYHDGCLTVELTEHKASKLITLSASYKTYGPSSEPVMAL